MTNDPDMSSTALLFFHMVNCSLAGIIAILVLMLLVIFFEFLKPVQRLGLSLMSAGTILWIPIFYMWPTPTPLNGWSTTMLMLGMAFYVSETLHRFFKHKWPNMQQIWYMKRDLAQRRRERGE